MKYKILITICLILTLINAYLIFQAYQAADSFDFEEYANTMIREQAAEVKDDFTTEVFEVSAYNTVKSQTDSNECESASGVNICDRDFGIVACPHKFPFGTEFEINRQKYVCLDRMNARYEGNYLDINFDKDIKGALEFGRQQLSIRVYE